MAKFNVKNYKLNSTPLSRLDRLSTPHLEAVLNYWSRIGNQRAKRFMKEAEGQKSMFSALYMYISGGKFGVHQTHMNRETMLNELIRIKNVASRITKKNVEAEKAEIEAAKSRVFEEAGAGDIDEKTFDRAFVIFKNRYYMVSPDFYNQVKEVVTKMKARKYLYEVADLIDRLYDEWEMQKVREKPDSANPFSPDQITKENI